MAFDRELATRVRDRIGPDPALSEKSMFGGHAFLVHGNMAVAVGHGGLLLRIDPRDVGSLTTETGVSRFVMHGRQVDGWLQVDPAAITTDAELQRWVDIGLERARSFPPR